MTKNTKIFLGVGCGVLLVIGLVIVIGAFIAMRTWGPQFLEATTRADTAGREFGKTTDHQGCMKEGMQRSKSTTLLDIGAGMELSVFVDACLKVSRETANFCDGVPSMFSLEANDWGAAECKKAGIDPEKTGCVHIMKRKHQFCNKL
jgi:hypothetical protein